MWLDPHALLSNQTFFKMRVSYAQFNRKSMYTPTRPYSKVGGLSRNPMPQNPRIIDGHNDTVLRFYGAKRLGIDLPSFFERNALTHIDFPRARDGGLGGGFFAMYTPNQFQVPKPPTYPGLTADGTMAYHKPLPPQVDQPFAFQVTIGMMSTLLRWETESDGQLKIVRTVDELQHCLDNDILAVIMHIEGAEAIDTDLDSLYVLHAAGLRSLGPVWSRPTNFGHGVPFVFPASPDTGNGLTPAGRRLVTACNDLGILIDMSHLNYKGFYDIAELSNAPLVCTHSGAHACCQSTRNLLDDQLDAIKQTNGLTGINYHASFLREDGNGALETPLTEIVRHAAYVADRIGVDHVALGSDFDGAKMPDDMVDVAGQPKLIEAFREHGFNEAEITQIAHGNWLRVLRATWKD